MTLQSFDVSKYDSLILPTQDVWGILLRSDDPLSEKKSFKVEDLMELPLILSREALRDSIRLGKLNRSSGKSARSY